VPFEDFIHETAAAQDNAVAEVAYTTAESLREGAAGVEDGLDGFPPRLNQLPMDSGRISAGVYPSAVIRSANGFRSKYIWRVSSPSSDSDRKVNPFAL
jgi:hypothetical protein